MVNFFLTRDRTRRRHGRLPSRGHAAAAAADDPALDDLHPAGRTSGPPFLLDIDDPGILADAVAPLLSVGIEQRQKIPETTDVVTRLETSLALLKAAQQAA
jgi:hypothetical protein